MRFFDFWKNHKAFTICTMAVVLFFLVLVADNQFKLIKMKRDYEKQIEELKVIIQMSETEETSEPETDLSESVASFLKCYYEVSADMPKEYREEKLKAMMTEEAYVEYGESDYDNTQHYTITLDDMYIYKDCDDSARGETSICVFYNENINWPEINTICLKKYWRGTFVFDDTIQQWLLSEIIDCQELLTREEFNSLNADTNGDWYEEEAVEGEVKDADSDKEKTETDEKQ